jgi:hypothetical protein
MVVPVRTPRPPLLLLNHSGQGSAGGKDQNGVLLDANLSPKLVPLQTLQSPQQPAPFCA